MRNPNYKKRILHSLQDLVKSYPKYSIGRHLSTAFSDYRDLWDVSDKEISFALDKYRSELELGIESDKSYDSFVEKVIEDSKHLGTGIENMSEEEEGEEDSF